MCLLLRHLTLATNSFSGLIFECEVNNKYINVLFMNPNLFLSPYFCIALVRQLVMIHLNSTKQYMLYIMMFEVNLLNETK